jgi:DNA-binding response OmpR family regulator
MDEKPMRHSMDERRTVIAIIDKDHDLIELYSLELLDMGYEVRATSDVESAQELIAACKPDLVLLDPYDGKGYRWDVVAEIRDLNAHLPVLMCLPFEIFPEDYSVRHADCCIIKSFDMSCLVWKVQSLLATKAAGRARV